MQKRKERHRAEREERARIHKERLGTKKDKANPRRGTSTWRRDQQGNIIFKNYLKFSPLAFIMIASVIVIAIFLVVTAVTNTEEAGICANPFCHFLDGSLFAPPPEKQIFAPPTSATTEARELPP